MLSESYEHCEQWSQPSERTSLSPEACLFIPRCEEHGCNGTVRAGSKPGQSSSGQFSVVSWQLPSGMELHTYEHAIILSRETMGGGQVSVQHPLSWEGFRLSLQDCPDGELVEFILHAIESGAALGTANSLPSRDPFRCRNGCMSQSEAGALREEVAYGLWAQHKIGPFAKPPFAGFRCSPVNAIPKKGTNKFRLIHNLSYPFGGRHGGRVGQIRSGKSVLVDLAFWHLLGLHTNEPDGKRQFFTDVSLPFSHCLLPAIFSKFAQALNYITQAFSTDLLFNYVDDYLIAQPPGTGFCLWVLGAMDMACDLMGFCGKPEKREEPVTCLSVLGIEVDSVAWELCIDPRRLETIMKNLLEWKQHVRATVKDIASLHGQLSFVACVVKPGCIFLWHIVEEMQRGQTHAFGCLAAYPVLFVCTVWVFHFRMPFARGYQHTRGCLVTRLASEVFRAVHLCRLYSNIDH